MLQRQRCLQRMSAILADVSTPTREHTPFNSLATPVHKTLREQTATGAVEHRPRPRKLDVTDELRSGELSRL